MEMTIEELLAERSLTWGDFCRDPYPIVADCSERVSVFCTRKQGHFLFHPEDILSVLLGEESFYKINTIDGRQHARAEKFFSTWLFYREDPEREATKRKLFRAIQSDQQRGIAAGLRKDLRIQDIPRTLRRLIFAHIAGIFFELREEQADSYFKHAEAVFSFIQGDRLVAEGTLDHHIAALENLFHMRKRFDFDFEFFRSAVLNAVVDGYEPFSDLCWNTVQVMLVRPELSAETAYAIAVATRPSFRYVVRHCRGESFLPSGRKVQGKVYCFLSVVAHEKAMKGGRSHLLSFGRGLHVCSGRGMVDDLVPPLARDLCLLLRNQGVNGIRLERSEGLGAEGVTGVDFILR